MKCFWLVFVVVPLSRFWNISIPAAVILGLASLFQMNAAEVLIPTDSVWKYLDDGTDQGFAWRGTNFNDSAWPSAPAQLGYGDGDEATVIGFGPDPQNKYITYYFRKTVVAPNPTVYTNLTLRVLRDDGVVVYFNSNEVWRVNIIDDPVYYTNYAVIGADWPEYDVVNLPPTVLQPGTNFIAVEMHQATANSSDLSFAMELLGDRSVANTPPTANITSPNNNQSFAAPATVNLATTASDTDGTASLVEFYEGSNKIGEDDSSPYNAVWSGVWAGSYQLRAVATDNLGARGTSAVVNITVTGNSAPTASITAPGSGSVFLFPTNVAITASASDPDNNLNRVEFYEGSNLLGTDSSSPYGVTWTDPAIGTYTVRAVAVDNATARGTSGPVTVSIASAAPTNLISRGSVWKYLDDGSDQGTAWRERTFDDTSWLSGPAQLGYGDGDEATVIGFGPDQNNKYPTTYFRHTFPVADPNAYVTLSLGVQRDDGAIVYLNGIEVFRTNVPEGPIDYSTYTGVSTSDETRFFPTNPPANLLVAGANVVAVEIHQHNGSSSDLSFDLEMIGRTSNERPTVSILTPSQNATYTEPATITFGVGASDADGTITLVEFFQNGAKLGEDTVAPYSLLWSDVPVGTYNLTAIATDNLNGRSTSSVATVFVTPAVPPVIGNVSPAAGAVSSLNQITVTFSENVSGVTAGDLLVNGVPATGVSGMHAVYTFTFPQPREGVVRIAWDGSHGITDFESPPQRFDHYGSGSTWQYTLNDTTAPTISSRLPVAGATVRTLSEVEVTFNEAVWGVDAADLLVAGTPATQVSGSGAGPYRFQFAQPSAGNITLSWAVGHGIRDFSAAANAFSGSPWNYTLQPSAVFEGNVVINEIMYHPASERTDEEFIEIYNRGGSTINLAGWQFTRGVDFTFPTVNLAPGQFLVVAADPARFAVKYPGVANVVGPWTGRLSNAREDIELEDASGARVDLVEYADEGDFALRMSTGQGWIWVADHDGLGRSLELVNPAMPNDNGQNWASSINPEGTPGQQNSTATNNIAPLILNVSHFPVVPRSTDSITISATVLDESSSGVTVTLRYADVTGGFPGSFSSATMFDDGAHGDGLANDRVYGATLSATGADGSIIEFYVETSDSGGRTRTWPAPGNTGQDVNAFIQVDDEVYAGSQSLYHLIMRPESRNAFLNNFDRVARNATFISVEGGDVEVRHRSDARRRGASSFGSTPPTMKLNFPRDQTWNGYSSVNLNSINTWAQVVGSAVSLKAGLPVARARGVQVRFNGVDESRTSSQMFGSYAHVEVLNDEWADSIFPLDGDGNVYAKRRPECGLEYRGTDPQTYINCAYEKQSNSSENDWSDLVNLFAALDPDITSDTDYVAAVRRNANVEMWMRYFAVLFLMNSTETTLATGDDDDYNMYRGIIDPRFLLIPHDFDQVFGSQGTLPDNIFMAAGRFPNVARFLFHPEFEPIYYQEYRRLLSGAFSTNQLFPLFDQILTGWVPQNTIQTMKDVTAAKINYVLSVLPPAASEIRATVAGEPASPTHLTAANLTVGGAGITHYRYRLNNGGYSTERTVATPIALSGLTDGTYTVYVIGRDAGGTYQAQSAATASSTWTVITSLAGVVINEVLARNDSVVNHFGTFPDIIELHNPRNTSVDLSGLRLSDDRNDPSKFTFPPGTSLAAGAYLVLYANDPDGTPGTHVGFALSQDGEGVYLFDRASAGGRLLDSVEFGAQLSNLSIGRANNGHWRLSTPSFGSVNVTRSTGDVRTLKINEWLTDGVFPLTEDFIEIYNPDALPVDLGGLHLSDNPTGLPGQHRIHTLHFIDGFGYRVFIANGDADAGADHVSFQLASERGEISLSGTDLSLIDCVTYTQQRAGWSQGRSPNGASTVLSFNTPTPGAGNPGVTIDDPQTISLIPLDGSFQWRYNQFGTNLGTAWRGTNYVDSWWPQGAGIFAFEDCNCLPEPIRTPLSIANGKWTFYFRARFTVPPNISLSGLQVRHVIDDGAVFYLNGQEARRYNINSGTVDFNTPADTVNNAGYVGPVSLPITNVFPGENLLAVEVHQNSANSPDVVFGLQLQGVVVTNSPGAAGIVINEVLADNKTFVEGDGTQPDWVELYNPSTAPVDLGNMSFTDTLSDPRRWVFPAGSVIPGQGYFKVRFDADTPMSATNSGFGLNATGDSLYLFNKPANGGGLLDSLSFGIQASDFSIGRVPNGGSNWVLNIPTSMGPNIAAPLGDVNQLRINEWMASPFSGDDWFEIFNPNAQPVVLSGLFLTDDTSTPQSRTNKYQAPPLSFLGVGSYAFQRFEADSNPAAGGNHVGFRLSAGGETLALYRTPLEAIDTVTFFGQFPGVSEGLLPDGTTNIFGFPNSASPGDANYLPLTTMVINEVLSHTDAPYEDAIELRNISGGSVDISGWYLSDSKNALRKYRIRSSPPTVVPAGGYIVFYENQFNSDPQSVTSFALNSAGNNNLYLSQATVGGTITGFRATASFGPAENAVSFGRYQTSQGFDFPALSRRTFGSDSPDNVEDFRLGTGLANAGPLVGPVVISEIMYHPPDNPDSSDNVLHEFVELQNITTAPVALYHTSFPSNTWRMRGGVDFNFPQGSSLNANGRVLLVSFDPVNDALSLAAFRTHYNVPTTVPILGPYLGKLDNGGEELELRKPDAPETTGPDTGRVPYIVVDRVVYSDATPPWPFGADGMGDSLQRINLDDYGNDPVNWRAAAPTPAPGGNDADGDGMPDDWEDLYSLNKNNPADASQDADGDGLSNLREYLAGTHPRQSGSSLRLAVIGLNPVRLQFSSVSNKTYTIEYQNNLAPGPWTKLTDLPAQATSGTREVTDPAANTTRFYRIRTPQSP